MVDVQERVESDNEGRMSPQVQSSKSVSCSQIVIVVANVVLCVSGIICITWHSRAGKCLCHCTGKRRAKSTLLNHLV